MKLFLAQLGLRVLLDRAAVRIEKCSQLGLSTDKLQRRGICNGKLVSFSLRLSSTAGDPWGFRVHSNDLTHSSWAIDAIFYFSPFIWNTQK